ncbi:hypothetical protein NDU88_005088 [Pleurodeles waltl]|uniref:Uncharacterized protein n=1 Tax=Pleurodeles waltl TaxID=8319 RepID=A0AAV7UL32_PLEWA|nr:hypothetical protein NDU88_005088 [Pleurodeles waltl]
MEAGNDTSRLQDERNTGSPGKTTPQPLTKRERKRGRKCRNRTSRTNITMATVSGPEEQSKEDIPTNPEEIREEDEPLREWQNQDSMPRFDRNLAAKHVSPPGKDKT